MTAPERPRGPRQLLTDSGLRFGVDLTIARIEDALRVLRKDAPLNDAEQAALGRVAQELEDLAPKERGR